jgi:hypothetical protein
MSARIRQHGTHFARKSLQCTGTAVAILALATAAAQAQPETEVVHYDGIDAQGRLTGGTTVMPRPVIPTRSAMAPVVSLTDSQSTNRVNLVIVGDGYQAAQLGLYAAHSQTTVSQLFNTEPFKTYVSVFNVFRVDVVSIDSGVDNDPVQGVLRNTALDMSFWCDGIERLLCVNVGKAYVQANSAPLPPDQVLAVANSSKYGGAGYTGSNLATVSGGDLSASEIAIHEFGHSLGDLADEYDYGGPTTYVGGEPPASNVSIHNAAALAAQQRKWFRWLGVNNPAFDGLVSAYQGANYSVLGIYRPSNNSKMRELYRPFNLPSAEAIIVAIYKKVKPIESSTPTTTVTGTPVIFVSPIQPINNPLAIQWSLDGSPIPGAVEPTLDLGSLQASVGVHTVSVTVVDNTFMVRDPNARAQWLTQSRSWVWNTCYPNCDASTGTPALTGNDFQCFLNRFVQSDLYADCDGVGGLTANDFQCFLNRYVEGCS